MNTYLQLMREDNSIGEILKFPKLSPKRFMNGLQNEKHRFKDFINLIGDSESVVQIRVHNGTKITNVIEVDRDNKKGIVKFYHSNVKNVHLLNEENV